MGFTMSHMPYYSKTCGIWKKVRIYIIFTNKQLLNKSSYNNIVLLKSIFTADKNRLLDFKKTSISTFFIFLKTSISIQFDKPNQHYQ
jgi:hypothetical protein